MKISEYNTPKKIIPIDAAAMNADPKDIKMENEIQQADGKETFFSLMYNKYSNKRITKPCAHNCSDNTQYPKSIKRITQI